MGLEVVRKLVLEDKRPRNLCSLPRDQDRQFSTLPDHMSSRSPEATTKLWLCLGQAAGGWSLLGC